MRASQSSAFSLLLADWLAGCTASALQNTELSNSVWSSSSRKRTSCVLAVELAGAIRSAIKPPSSAAKDNTCGPARSGRSVAIKLGA